MKHIINLKKEVEHQPKGIDRLERSVKGSAKREDEDEDEDDLDIVRAIMAVMRNPYVVLIQITLWLFLILR